jgi:hypothetical protein
MEVALCPSELSTRSRSPTAKLPAHHRARVRVAERDLPGRRGNVPNERRRLPHAAKRSPVFTNTEAPAEDPDEIIHPQIGGEQRRVRDRPKPPRVHTPEAAVLEPGAKGCSLGSGQKQRADAEHPPAGEDADGRLLAREQTLDAGWSLVAAEQAHHIGIRNAPGEGGRAHGGRELAKRSSLGVERRS